MAESRQCETGDIFLFKGETDDTLDRLIMWLSGSDVTHAALVYDADTLADSALAGLNKHHFVVDPKGREVFQMRMPGRQDFTPVINAANVYVDADTPYDKPALILAGLLLMYKKFSRPGKVQKVISRFLRFLAKDIDNALARYQHPGKHPMTCSQFVATAYTQAGTEYELKLEHPDLLQARKGGNLIGASHHFLQQTPLPPLLASVSDVDSDWDALCQDVFDHLVACENEDDAELQPETVAAVSAFCRSLSQSDDGQLAVHIVKAGEELFVTPGDLRNHCVNLQFIDSFPINRNDTPIKSQPLNKAEAVSV